MSQLKEAIEYLNKNLDEAVKIVETAEKELNYLRMIQKNDAIKYQVKVLMLQGLTEKEAVQQALKENL